MADNEKAKIEDDDLIVEIDDGDVDGKDDVVVEKAEDKKASEPEIPVEEGIAEVKRKLEEETAARKAAERIAAEAKNRESAARTEVDETNSKLIENAINTIDGNLVILKQRMREAVKKGDADAIVDIQAEISELATEKVTLRQGKEAYEAKKKETPKVTTADPVEALAAQLTPRSASWVRSHPEYARDARLFQKMIAAHNLAVADGYETDSDEYFANVEATLKIAKPQEKKDDDAMSEASKTVTRRSSPASAPVSRSAPDNSGKKPNVVTLTKEEREMAEMMGMTAKEYAKNKLALIKEGKMS